MDSSPHVDQVDQEFLGGARRGGPRKKRWGRDGYTGRFCPEGELGFRRGPGGGGVKARAGRPVLGTPDSTDP